MHGSSILERGCFAVFIQFVDEKMRETHGRWRGNRAFEMYFSQWNACVIYK